MTKAGNFTCELNIGKNNDTIRELRPLHGGSGTEEDHFITQRYDISELEELRKINK